MTRDEAVSRYISGNMQSPAFARYADREQVGFLVDGLAALGVLTLDDEIKIDGYCVPPKEVATILLHRISRNGRIVTARWLGDQVAWRIGDRLMTVDEATEQGWRYVGIEHSPNTMRVDMTVVEDDRVRRSTFDMPLPADRCEPPPEHRGKLYHWIEMSGPQMVVRQFGGGAWTSFTGERTASEDAAKRGWRYVAPCEEPKLRKSWHVRGETPAGNVFDTVIGAETAEEAACKFESDRLGWRVLKTEEITT